MRTLRDIFLAGKKILGGSAAAEREAKTILLHCTAISEEQFYSSPDKVISEEEKDRFLQLSTERAAGIPLAYLTGRKEFWSIPLIAGRGALIPRPETELVVETAVSLSAGQDEIIVDLGTGSGNIALALAAELPMAWIIATDISRKALKIAGDNAVLFGSDRIVFERGSLFRPLRKLGMRGACHFIVSNPPYISRPEWQGLDREIRDHEPRKALLAGDDGLKIIRPLVRKAPDYLRPGGYLILEIGYNQKESVLSLFDRKEWRSVSVRKDINGIPRVIAASRSENFIAN